MHRRKDCKGRAGRNGLAVVRWAMLSCCGLLAACSTTPSPTLGAPAPPAAAAGSSDALPPEAASGWRPQPVAQARHFMVAAAHPLATEAGVEVLRAGGTALDAAVAVQMVLAVVEPQSSGLGGGAFLMHFDGRTVQAWDGRETAPAAADERLFLRADGQPLSFTEARAGGRAVGVPGAVRMLDAAHRQHGRLPWARLLQPAIDIAEQGFDVSPRLHTLLRVDTTLRRDAAAAAFYFDAAGQPWPAGHRLRNPALAAVLRAIAVQGSEALHLGPVAADISKRVRGHATDPGSLTEADLAAYQPVLREALCSDWQALYRVCGFPPPSSGHVAMMQMLGMLDHAAAPAALVGGIPGADWLHVYTEAARLAFADRAQFIADPAFTPAPSGGWNVLLADAYLRQRAALIGPRSLQVAPPGRPGGQALAFAAQATQTEAGTSHLSIVDAEGHALALTTTIEAAFGSGLLIDGGSGLPGGFLLNNQLTDFSFLPADAEGRPVANRVQPGKRPRSSMSPTLVFERGSGRLLMSLGSAGGAGIIHSTAKTLLGTLAWGLDLQRAIDLPNAANFNGPTLLEAGRFPPTTQDALRARGHDVQEVELTSGLHAVQRTPKGWQGGADPRREGVARGDR